MLITVNINTENVETNDTIIVPTITNLGNNYLGTVVKEGPYGNTSSNIKIGIILGVHPREKGAHQLMEQAFKDNNNTLHYCYYIYKVNVTKNPTDFSASRMNGQKLANEFLVPDMISNNFTFAIDSHYSNGYWGVSRFIFSPSEDNILSTNVGHAITDNFDWIDYYVPPDPTSPQYVTEPLNDGGVAAIIYEAYTNDNRTSTYAHDKELISFIDNYNFSNIEQI